MATASASETPNPNSMKFSLDVRLPAPFNFSTPAAAAGHPFATAVFAIEGVASVFGVSDFVTVSRRPGADWDPILAGVTAAAAELL